eukprot:4030738-Prymnesium_polylepis.1
MIDRGADISYLSQYPHEAETLFAPLTGLEVQSTRVQGSVLVVGVGLSVNLTALTIDQVLAKRKKIVESAVDGAALEARAAVLASEAPEFAEAAEDSVRMVTEGGLLSREAEWFNDDVNLSWAVDRVVKVKANLLKVLEGSKLKLDFREFNELLCTEDKATMTEVPMWLGASPVVRLCKTLMLSALGSLSSVEGLSGC